MAANPNEYQLVRMECGLAVKSTKPWVLSLEQKTKQNKKATSIIVSHSKEGNTIMTTLKLEVS